MTPRHSPNEDAVRARLRAQPESGEPAPASGQPDSDAGAHGGPSPDPAAASLAAAEAAQRAAAAAAEQVMSPEPATDADAPAAGAAPEAAAGGEAGGDTGAAASANGGPAAHAPGSGPTVGDPLAEAERQRDEYLALAQRTQASFDNFRKRAARDAAMAGARAKGELARELLPAIDNLERALQAAGDADEGLVHGLRLVLADLAGALERAGIQAFEPVGERFDPQVHEAISMRPAGDGGESGAVVEVVQKGYRIEENVIRPARVVVAG